MAVTSAEAEAAIARAEELTKAMEAAQWLTGAKLEVEITSLRQVSNRVLDSLLWACSKIALNTTTQQLHGLWGFLWGLRSYVSASTWAVERHPALGQSDVDF